MSTGLKNIGKKEGDKVALFVSFRQKFSPVTLNLWITIRNIKHRLIAQIEANLQDESIKSN